MSDEDELGLLGLDERGDVVEAVLEDERLRLGNLLALSAELSLVAEPVLLGLLGLGLVVLEELVQVLGCSRAKDKYTGQSSTSSKVEKEGKERRKGIG